jgi:amino acid adenylation domain-containing protein
MPGLLHHTIDEAAQHDDLREAFRYLDLALNYGELTIRTNQLAQMLVQDGVRPGDRVGLYAKRSLEWAIGIYGILKAGAAYVPIDPFTPPANVRKIISHCEIRHLITHAPMQRQINALLEAPAPPPLESIIGLAGDCDDLRFYDWSCVDTLDGTSAPCTSVGSNDPAYIMYTSGSTGTPKGIIHTHYSGLSYARLSAQTYGIQPADRIGNHSPLHFDMSTLGFLTSPYVGATTVILSEAHTKLPVSLAQIIESERISIWYSVPLALTQLLYHGLLDQCDMSALRWVLYGGEPFPPKSLYALMKRWPQARFSNVYGPAEVNQCTYFHIPAPKADASEEELERSVPLGRIWEETEGLILDSNDSPVSPGECGELLIHSPTMMQGYWGRPELNEKIFFRHKDKEGHEQPYYRTGDLVHRINEESLLFLGRKDRQIKTRGYRVELDDVENALACDPTIEEAAVYAVKDENGSSRIEGAFVPQDCDEPGVEEITRFLQARLPWYAIPVKLTPMQSLPLTATGKIDRRALCGMAQSQTDATK